MCSYLASLKAFKACSVVPSRLEVVPCFLKRLISIFTPHEYCLLRIELRIVHRSLRLGTLPVFFAPKGLFFSRVPLKYDALPMFLLHSKSSDDCATCSMPSCPLLVCCGKLKGYCIFDLAPHSETL